MPIESAVFHASTWEVFWTAPGETVVVNPAPIAAFTTSQPTPSSPVVFDGTGSGEEGGGSIVTWAWDFGDGSATEIDSTAVTSHQYAQPGIYSAQLIVTDDSGFSAQTTLTITVVVDIAPEAIFTATLVGLTVTVDATASLDRDGAIVDYEWDFGDGATASGMTTNHLYAFGGSYDVTLTVTDNLGAIDLTTQTIAVSYLPTAAFVFTTSGRTANVDASGTDDFNPISLYTWSWGVAGSTDSFGVRASHTYAADGTYPISLTVKDVAGNEDTVTHEVTVAIIKAPDPPVVVFSETAVDLKASFDASKSTDDDSTILAYAWNFGDTHTGSGVTTSHTYSLGGTYSVLCTATDQLGAVGSARKSITVSLPKPPNTEETHWAYQDFNRRQVIADDDYDPDISWQHHLDRGSLGGVDHNAPYGTPLYANSSGRCYQTSLANGGTGGRTLSIYTGSTGWYDQYMHLSSFAVSDGALVSQGQLVGHSGASGDGVDFFYAPHFHLHRYTPGGTRVNSWHYFCHDGTHDSRNVKPGLIIVTLSTGVPNITFYRRLQWYAGLNGYAYPCDGYMSIPAWKGVQQGLRNYGYTGPIDGVPGTDTYKALQQMAHQHGSTSPIDGTLSTLDYIGISKRLNLL